MTRRVVVKPIIRPATMTATQMTSDSGCDGSTQRRRRGRLVPPLNRPPRRQLEHEHVDRRQHQQHNLRAEIAVVEVHRGVRDEHQHAGHRGQTKAAHVHFSVSDASR